MRKLVSIIIPVYKVEKYLTECIESVLKQTYSNIEILLIDDGSPDNSGKICDKYAEKDSRIKVVHKENGGVSSARNVGLEHAKGEYIAFVDSDDFVDESYIEKMYINLQENKSDLVFCGFADYLDEKVVLLRQQIPEMIQVNFHDKLFRNFIVRFFNSKIYINSSTWRILYKRLLIEDLRFNLDIKIGEDLIFLLQAICRAKKITSIDEHLYFYRKDNESATRSYKKNFLNNQLELSCQFEKIFKNFEESQVLLQGYNTLLCYYAFSNEIKYRKDNFKKSVAEIRNSKLYQYFKLKNGLRLCGLKSKLKFLIIWFLVKTRLI